MSAIYVLKQKYVLVVILFECAIIRFKEAILLDLLECHVSQTESGEIKSNCKGPLADYMQRMHQAAEEFAPTEVAEASAAAPEGAAKAPLTVEAPSAPAS